MRYNVSSTKEGSIVLDNLKAASLVEGVVSGDLNEPGFRDQWPKSASTTEDLRNLRENALELFAARRKSDIDLIEALEGDLGDAVEAIRSERKILWFSAVSKWHWLGLALAIAMGASAAMLLDYLGATTWAGRLAFWFCIGTYCFIDWRWAVRHTDSAGAS